MKFILHNEYGLSECLSFRTSWDLSFKFTLYALTIKSPIPCNQMNFPTHFIIALILLLTGAIFFVVSQSPVLRRRIEYEEVNDFREPLIEFDRTNFTFNDEGTKAHLIHPRTGVKIDLNANRHNRWYRMEDTEHRISNNNYFRLNASQQCAKAKELALAKNSGTFIKTEASTLCIVEECQRLNHGKDEQEKHLNKIKCLNEKVAKELKDTKKNLEGERKLK